MKHINITVDVVSEFAQNGTRTGERLGLSRFSTSLDLDPLQRTALIESITTLVTNHIKETESLVNSGGQLPKSNELTSVPVRLEYQDQVYKWVKDCLGEDVAEDHLERGFRFLEEAMELAQCMGITQREAEDLANHVFNKPIGDTFQEVGGSIVTLSALCAALGIVLNDAANQELSRCIQKTDKIRAKHFSKLQSIRSPLPGKI